MKPSPQGPVRIFTTRSGRKVELVAVLPECRAVYGGRIIGLLAAAGKADRGVLWWRMNGRYLEIAEHDWDLMDLPAEGLVPTVPPTGQPSPTGLPRIQRNCEEIIRQAQDVIARTRLLMLRDVERVPVVVPRGQLTEHDLGGTEHLPGQRSAVAEGGSLGETTAGRGEYLVATCGEGGSAVWKPAGDQTDWGRAPPLTEGAARHQLLDELLTPVMLGMRQTGPRAMDLSAAAKQIILTALCEAGYGKPKEATAAGPPAK